MSKAEFLAKLEEVLAQELSPQAVQENITYYSQYISSETAAGKTEEQVVSELGDPWVIARTIIDTQGSQGQAEYVYESPEKHYQRGGTQQSSMRMFSLDTWWKKLLLILGLVGIACLVFAIVTGIISLIAPILIPVLVVLIIIRLVGGRRR